MRLHESDTVKVALGKVGIDLHVVNCTADFAAACTTTAKGKRIGPLIEAIAPEDKRMIIGDTFMTVTEAAVASLRLDPNNVYLAQGTLRPDLIESGSHLASAKADVIKTHHNDTALVRKLRDEGKIVEPLKDYHKDEVRALGKGLGLPKHLVWRQPFPGPGLAIRVLCSDGSVPDTLSAAEVAKIRALIESGTTMPLAFTVLPVRTVGVQGDCRSYKAAVALSLRGGGDVAKMDWPALFAIARQIPSEVPNVSRTCFMFGDAVEHGTPGSSDVTPTVCSQPVMDQLRQADHVVSTVMLKHNLHHTLSQVPVVLFPASFGVKGNRSVALRPFITRDFMTGTPAVPGKDIPFSALREWVKGIEGVKGVSKVVYDLTAKPPGTTEWE
jgi:GMP synthase (glutamine-hydrolysing)